MDRALAVIRFLQRERRASFGELYEELAPISRTTLSALLSSLKRLEEVEHVGREYMPARGVLGAGDIQFYELPRKVRARTQSVLTRVARESSHACAIFARVGTMTMRIVDQCNLPDGDWRFSPVGYEWPLVPFHGFAKVFLADSDPELARSCYGRWNRHLRPELIPGSWEDFAKQLGRIRKKGYALEYQEESREILRLAAPIHESSRREVRFVVGIVARNVYLLEADECLRILLPAAKELSSVLGDL
nr:IclR family transcriptional regulator C-terminal domain-containing protein [Puniceicoccus vermicola]